MKYTKMFSLIFCLLFSVTFTSCNSAEEKPTEKTETTTPEKPAADMETKSEKTEETTASSEEEVDVDEDAFEEEDGAEIS